VGVAPGWFANDEVVAAVQQMRLLLRREGGRAFLFLNPLRKQASRINGVAFV
jgi:hypothetical protein